MEPQKIEFVWTKHAQERFNERFNQDDRNRLLLASRIASKGVRKRIRKYCPKNQTDADHVYYVNDYHHNPRRLVFVCKPTSGKYIVKTFFVLKEKPEEQDFMVDRK